MQYVNIINQKYIDVVKRGIYFPKYKLELLNYSENVCDEIIQYIDKDGSGEVSFNYQQGVRSSCSLTLANIDGKFTPNPDSGLLWIGSKFKLYIGVEDIYTGDIYWFSQGVYFINNPSISRNFSNVVTSIEGVDKFSILSGELGYSHLGFDYKIPTGTNIYSAIKDILMIDMGNGYVLDPVDPFLDPIYRNEVMPYELNKSSNETLGDILIELANVLGANIFYDKNGRLNIKSGTLDISYSQESPIWDFADIKGDFSEPTLKLDYQSVVNSITVVGNNINDKIYSYTAENHNPQSPTRIEYIGKKTETIETPMAYNEDRAKDYAMLCLNRKSITQSVMDFTCCMIPHLDVDCVIAISDTFYNYKQQRFIIQSLSMPLNARGQMNVSVSNLASLPYYDFVQGS